MRRIVAIVLPQLACEIARRKRLDAGAPAVGPLGVILEPDASVGAALPTAELSAVSDEARRYGVRPGQRVPEAAALVASLSVQRITHGELDAALGRVAEIALGFGPTAALKLRVARSDEPRTPWGDAPFDTVWLDVTGAAHLAGGEEELLAELEERVGALGHRARLAIAGGPRLAQALARFAPGVHGTPGRRAGRYPIAPARAEGSALAPLPLQALPIEPEVAGFLLRLGVLTVGDLTRLPRAKVAARLGVRAPEILELAGGRDEAPLLPFALPREIVEETSFEEGVESTEALLFVLRGMASRAALRLLSRGEACTRIEVELPLDRSIARLRRGEGQSDEAIRFHVELPAPLVDEADLLRALRARLERTALFAPAVGVRLGLTQIVPAASRSVQLDLSREKAADPDSLPTLLAELSAEIGADRIGLLATVDAHRPEAQSRLVPVTLTGKSARKEQLSFAAAWSKKAAPMPAPARMLPAPISLGKVQRGSVVAIGGGEPQLFAVERLAYLMRLDGVEWWTKEPASRDYARAWLASGDDGGRLARTAGNKRGPKAACAEALVYVVRRTGEMFLQGWYE